MTVKQAICGIARNHGGDGGMLRVESGRLLTICYDCGYRSSGVTVTPEGYHRARDWRHTPTYSWWPPVNAYIMLLQWSRGKQ